MHNAMGQEQILMMKDQMKEMIDAMKPDNAEVCFKVLSSQYETLRSLYEIQSLKASVGLLNDCETCEEDEPTVPDTPAIQEDIEEVQEAVEPEVTPVVQEVQAPVDARAMYRVERKLKGAFVSEIDGYIPEMVLREKDIEHGDYVYATAIPSQRPGQKRYEYELAKKMGEAPPANRMEYRGCPIEKDGWMLVVTKSSATGERIRIDEVPQSMVIKDKDIDQFDLKEGDIVDIAFYSEHSGGATVIWKYDISECVEADKPVCKKQESVKAECSAKADVEQVFAGKTICIVGDKPNEASYRALIEERGGIHIQIEPRWGVNRIENLVKKSDAVVGLYDVSKHTGLETAKAACKLYNVPFAMISGRGKSKAIQSAVELLNLSVSPELAPV